MPGIAILEKNIINYSLVTDWLMKFILGSNIQLEESAFVIELELLNKCLMERLVKVIHLLDMNISCYCYRREIWIFKL